MTNPSGTEPLVRVMTKERSKVIDEEATKHKTHHKSVI